MSKDNVVRLFDERWVEGVFEASGIRVDISSKGRVRFSGEGILSMEQMLELGQVLTTAYAEDDGG